MGGGLFLLYEVADNEILQLFCLIFAVLSYCSYDWTAGEDQIDGCEWWGATIRQCTTTLPCDCIAECATRNQCLSTDVPRRRQRQYTAIQSWIRWVLNTKTIEINEIMIKNKNLFAFHFIHLPRKSSVAERPSEKVLAQCSQSSIRRRRYKRACLSVVLYTVS